MIKSRLKLGLEQSKTVHSENIYTGTKDYFEFLG